jgi:hypothetical protein
MKKGDYLTTILRSAKTVLTFKDIVLLWQDSNLDAVRVRLNYYVKNGDLYRIRRGLYAKGREYDKLELATRIFTPSYVSFETILTKEGLTFQYQTSITIASYLTRNIAIEKQTYSYKKIKNSALTNTVGIEFIHESSVATKERAFLDILYIYTNFHFDNLRSLDWDKVFTILPIYNNKRMTKIINKLFMESKINK